MNAAQGCQPGAAADWHIALDERLNGEVAPDIWQVIVLESVPRLLRGFVTGSIKRGLPEAMHARSFPRSTAGLTCLIESVSR